MSTASKELARLRQEVRRKRDRDRITERLLRHLNEVKLAPAYLDGVSLRKIAKVAGISHEWARQRLKREGVQLRSRGPAPKLQRQAA